VDVLPKLEAKGVKAFLVTIGTAERGLEFAQLTAFPADRLLADPDAATYAALDMRNDIGSMFFNVQVSWGPACHAMARKACSACRQ
jgi:hypothetical protein